MKIRNFEASWSICGLHQIFSKSHRVIWERETRIFSRLKNVYGTLSQGLDIIHLKANKPTKLRRYFTTKNCETEYVIYFMECTICNLQYVVKIRHHLTSERLTKTNLDKAVWWQRLIPEKKLSYKNYKLFFLKELIKNLAYIFKRWLHYCFTVENRIA